jgi:hypothetical protein
MAVVFGVAVSKSNRPCGLVDKLKATREAAEDLFMECALNNKSMQNKSDVVAGILTIPENSFSSSQEVCSENRNFILNSLQDLSKNQPNTLFVFPLIATEIMPAIRVGNDLIEARNSGLLRTSFAATEQERRVNYNNALCHTKNSEPCLILNGRILIAEDNIPQVYKVPISGGKRISIGIESSWDHDRRSLKDNSNIPPLDYHLIFSKQVRETNIRAREGGNVIQC